MIIAKKLWAGCCLFLAAFSIHAGETEHVFLVTADGLRWQEVFRGADPELMKEENKKSSGIENYGRIRERYWAEDARQRREILMPFLWKELSREGLLIGNRDLGSKATLRNPHRFSYPGYAEILNGQHVIEVTSNDSVFSPRQTVVEFIRQELALPPEKAPVFGSWKIFNWIVMQKEGSIFCNAGYEALPEKYLTDRSARYNQVQFQMLSPWDTVRHDTPTLELALEFVRQQQPRFLYLALGETDDWAHDRRYDRVLQATTIFDNALKQLWTLIQNDPHYRGKTTMIVTVDHGRGRQLSDWTSHGKDVSGAEEIWIGVFGPDSPKTGEVSGGSEATLSMVAASILKLYGLDYRKFNPHADPPGPFFKD